MESPPQTDPGRVELRSLVSHTGAVDADTMVEAVQTEFARTNAKFLAVLENGKLLGVCAQRELMQSLGTRFGFSLNARQPVRALLMARPLYISTDTAITEVFKLAAGRADHEFYDDVLLVDEHQAYLGMIPVRTLVRLQTEFLLGNIVKLEASRQEIAAKNEEMESDLLMAREVQMAMLPTAYAPLSTGHMTLNLAHHFHPTGGVSGDFFDILRLPGDRVGILVCDVMGHGVRSALITAMVRAMIEELKPMATEPGLFLTRLNHDLTTILRQTGSLIFVTAAYIVIDPLAKNCRYAQAGHPTPLRTCQPDGLVRPIQCSPDSSGPALGLMDEYTFAVTEEEFAVGDRIVLFTDGLTEAPAPDGEEFGTKRLAESLDRLKTQPLTTALDALFAEVAAFHGQESFPDDICLVAAELVSSGN